MQLSEAQALQEKLSRFNTMSDRASALREDIAKLEVDGRTVARISIPMGCDEILVDKKELLALLYKTSQALQKEIDAL